MNGGSEIVIDVNGLTKKFGHRTVVRDLSMKVTVRLATPYSGDAADALCPIMHKAATIAIWTSEPR